MRIQLKRSDIVETSGAKEPQVSQMDYGEIAVNYNTADPTLFIKDHYNQIIPIAGRSQVLDLIEENQSITVGDSAPSNPSNNDLWLNTLRCPPELNVYSDCSGTGQWTDLGYAPADIDPEPGDISGINQGAGTKENPYVLTPLTLLWGESGTSVETITISNQVLGDFVTFSDDNADVNGIRFEQNLSDIDSAGQWSGKLTFKDIPESTEDVVYTGLLKIGSSDVYLQWVVIAECPVDLAKPEVLAPQTGSGDGATTFTPKTSPITSFTQESGGWNLITDPPPQSGCTWDSVAYGQPNGLSQPIYVAIGYWNSPPAGGKQNVMTSTDGINWTFANGPNGDYIWQSVIFNNGYFTAVGWSNTQYQDAIAMYSTNGTSWSLSASQTSDGKQYWVGVAYGNGKYVAVSNGSVDGKTLNFAYNTNNGGASNWTRVSGPQQTFYDVAFGNGKFVAVGYGYIYYSTDGINWTQASGVPYVFYKAVTFGNGKFVVLVSNSNNAQVLVSTDGVNWTQINAPNKPWYTVAYGDNKFIALSMNSTQIPIIGMYSEDDGSTWNTFAVADKGWRGIVRGGDKWVAVGGSTAMWSTTGTGINEAQLTLTDDKAYEEETDADSGDTISQVFFPGDKVFGEKSGEPTVTGRVKSVTGSTMEIDGILGPDVFVNGMEIIRNSPVTEFGPGASDLEFVGSAPVEDPEGGVETWGNATWQVADNSGFTALMEGTKLITDDTVNQTLKPNERGSIALAPSTQYWVRVKYGSTTPGTESEYSDSVTFKTAPNVPLIDDVFKTVPYAGSFPVAQTVTTGIDTVNNDGLLWLRPRSYVSGNRMFDTKRPYLDDPNNPTFAQSIATNSSSNQYPESEFNNFETTGFKLYAASSAGALNGDHTYVSWNFLKSPTFFDFFTYTGTGSSQTLSHNLGTKPGFILLKAAQPFSGTQDWSVYHEAVDATKELIINSQDIPVVNSNAFDDTEPTSSELTVGSDNSVSGTTYVAYVFANTPGLIKCASYQASFTDTVVNCGFEPSWIMIKDITTSRGWYILDQARGGKTGNQKAVRADSGVPEEDLKIIGGFPGSLAVNFTDTGFTIVGASNEINYPDREYIYVAIAKDAPTTFFDPEAFLALTESQVAKRFGVNPATVDASTLPINRLTHEPCDITETFVQEGDRYRPVECVTGDVNDLDNDIEDIADRIEDINDELLLRIEALENAANNNP